MTDSSFENDWPEVESLASLEACHRLASEAKPRPEKRPGMGLEGRAPSPGRDKVDVARRASARP